MGAICIVVRHGRCDGSSKLLSPEGVGQMQELAQAVKRVNVDRLTVRLLCSTAARAQQGGEIIAKELEIPRELTFFSECFWNDDKHPGDIYKAQEIIDQNLVEDSLLIVLSHEDFAPSLASHVLLKLGSVELPWQTPSCGKGWMISSTSFSAFPV